MIYLNDITITLQMEITFLDSISDSVVYNDNRLISETKPIVQLDHICLPSEAYGEVIVNITLPKQTHVTPGAKHKWIHIQEEESMDGILYACGFYVYHLFCVYTHPGFSSLEGASKILLGRLKGKFEQTFEAITTYRIGSTVTVSSFTVKVTQYFFYIGPAHNSTFAHSV